MTADRRRYLLILGLDYGTSYSKMVIREVNQKLASTVTNQQNHYLFPSVFGYREECLYAPLCNPCPNAILFLKMSAPDIALNLDEMREIQPFLTSLLQKGDRLQRVRALLAWQFCGFLVNALDFLKNRSRWKDYDPARDILMINLGLPMEHLQCQSTKDLFLGALAAAWEMAPSCEALADGNARADLVDWENVCSQTEWPPSDAAKNVLFLYPEVAAGVQSVMQSATAIDGIYMTLDVGSGTLDANTFRRVTRSSNDDESANSLSYYAARVSRLGISRLADHGGHHIFAEFPHLEDAVSPESTTGGMTAGKFFAEVSRELMALEGESLVKQPNRGKNPHRTWDSCRIYGFGGGMYNSEYRRHLEEHLLSWIDNATIVNLPTPPDLEMPSKADYSRLAIAYGLSFPVDNLETPIPPSKVPDQEPDPRNHYRPDKPGDPGFWTLD